jgi:site-specific DNA recombinase
VSDTRSQSAEGRMRQAVLYARVSSKDQEREGFSIPAQLKFLREYAQSHEFNVLREFVDVETAKTTGRKQFGEMVRFLSNHKMCRVVLVEKTDRLYRNFRDCVTLEDLDVEIHLPKEGQIISKDSKSQAKLVHGIQLVIARNYIENLRDEVRKGMREKAAQGIYPSRPPLGYRNNKLLRTIEVDPDNAPIAQRMFELYATGSYSLASLGQLLKAEYGKALSKWHIEKLLRNPFYIGTYEWEGKSYAGTHPPLVSPEIFSRVRDVLSGKARPRKQIHEFAFSGLLRCAYDNCAVTAEFKKQKYTYYRCTGYRGKCDLPYFREEVMAERLGQVLQAIRIPDDVLTQLEESLLSDKTHEETLRKRQAERIEQRLALLRKRLEQAYVDRLDGKITEEFWEAKSAEWQEEEQALLASLRELEQAENPERALDRVRILELANKAHSLYVTQTPQEKAKLLRMVLSNCAVDAVSVYPTYRKPFDMIFERAKTGEWWAWVELNYRPHPYQGCALAN